VANGTTSMESGYAHNSTVIPPMVISNQQKEMRNEMLLDVAIFILTGTILGYVIRLVQEEIEFNKEEN